MLKFFSQGFILKSVVVLTPIFLLLTVILLPLGTYMGYFIAPLDYQQGEAVKIMYIHVPSAWVAIAIYSMMAIFSLSYLIWRSNHMALLASSFAPIGTIFALTTLVTGSLWGKPIWGTWWVFDARLTSMLILFLIYIGYIALFKSHRSRERAYLSTSILCVLGFINIPIIKFSVDYWNSLHQKASILRLSGSTIHESMLYPLLISIAGFFCCSLFLGCIKFQTEVMKAKITRLENKIISKER